MCWEELFQLYIVPFEGRPRPHGAVSSVPYRRPSMGWRKIFFFYLTTMLPSLEDYGYHYSTKLVADCNEKTATMEISKPPKVSAPFHSLHHTEQHTAHRLRHLPQTELTLHSLPAYGVAHKRITSSHPSISNTFSK